MYLETCICPFDQIVGKKMVSGVPFFEEVTPAPPDPEETESVCLLCRGMGKRLTKEGRELAETKEFKELFQWLTKVPGTLLYDSSSE